MYLLCCRPHVWNAIAKQNLLHIVDEQHANGAPLAMFENCVPEFRSIIDRALPTTNSVCCRPLQGTANAIDWPLSMSRCEEVPGELLQTQLLSQVRQKAKDEAVFELASRPVRKNSQSGDLGKKIRTPSSLEISVITTQIV